ncbi:MAG: tetratricopeptide repeat protein, partial [Candidatus Glassbacteria bacterium]|nr:tetratricopeptide repeat protein [Candidatus Glassbacteria bacterium]
MHLFLLIPSSLLLALLFAHSWKYRGRALTVGFFLASFVFGIIRGNLIYWIITRVLGGDSLPYLFVRPMVRIWNASLQECVGWTFMLYLCWSLSERILARRGEDTVPVFRLAGLVCLLMGASAYAVEAVAAGVQWWVWVIPIRNPYFAAVPFAGITAWISVGFDFLMPFLLIAVAVPRRRWAWLTVLIFPLHMLTHTKTTGIADWLPLNTFEVWHWLMLCAIFAGIALGGPGIRVPAREKAGEPKPWQAHAVRVAAGGFLLVLGASHLFIIRGIELLISLVPFATSVLFVWPLYAAGFCLACCAAYGLAAGGWSFTLAPLALLALCAYAALAPRPAGARGRLVLRWSLAAFLVLCTAWVYLFYQGRRQHYGTMSELSARLQSGGAATDTDSLAVLLPRPRKPEDAFQYNSLAVDLNRRGLYRRALFILDEGLACDSTFSYLYFNLGWAHSQTGDLEAAAAAYERGLELDPIDYGSYLILGEIYESQGLKEKAEELYRRGLGYDPLHTGLVLTLERLLYSTGRLDEAIALLKGVLPG